MKHNPCPTCGKHRGIRPPKRSNIIGRPRKVDYGVIANMKKENPMLTLRELAHRNKCTIGAVQRALIGRVL